MPSHVYILRHVAHARFKIGKANDILARSRRFGWTAIDFPRSLGLMLATEKDAYALENVLLRIFHFARLDAAQVVASGDSADGATEWFDDECWPRLLRYLEDNRDLHPHEVISGDALAASMGELLQLSASEQAREQRKREKNARRAEIEAMRMALRERQMAELERDMQQIRLKLIDELEHHVHNRNIVGICHGQRDPSLLLASNTPSKSEMLWRLDIPHAQYWYPNHQGALIGNIRQQTISDGTVCDVVMPLLTLREDSRSCDVDEVIHRVFANEIAWLRQLPITPVMWRDAIFEKSLYPSSRIKFEEGNRAAARLLKAHRQAPHEIPPLICN